MSAREPGDTRSKRFFRAGHAVALAACLAALSACSSDDRRPLVLVNVTLDSYAVLPESVVIAATAGTTELATMTVSPNAAGRYGIWLPDGTSGNITLHAAVLGSGGCLLASGSVAGFATPGETTGPFVVPLVATGSVCVSDAGVSDAPIGPDDTPSPLDSAAGDAPLGDAAAPVDGGDVASDTRAPDAESLDLGQPDVTLDQAADASGLDGAEDTAPGLDGATDAGEAGSTTMGILAHCVAYDHSDDWDDAYGVRQVLFSPDGTYLVSVGTDGRLKVWAVTPSAIAPLANGLELPGGSRDNPVAAFSADGRYLAVGEGLDLAVTVYDFAASVQGTGGAVVVWTIPRTLLPTSVNNLKHLRFTTDGGYLAAYYAGDALRSPQQSDLIVWELAHTPTTMKQVSYPLDEVVHDIALGAYGDPIRVASATAAYLDGGQHTTLVVTDVIAVPAVKAQATLPGEVDRVAFAPDGSLVVGLAGTGEVRRWTVSGSEIVPEALPLVAPTAGGTMVNAGFALTLDGRYLAVAAYDDSFSRLVDLVPLALNEPLRKLATEEDPRAVAFAPSGLALAVGEAGKSTFLYCTP